MPPYGRGPGGGVSTRAADNKTHDVKYVLRKLWKYVFMSWAKIMTL